MSSPDTPFQFMVATQVTATEPAKAVESNVGDTTQLPKPENEPKDLNLQDTSVKAPVLSSDECAAMEQTTVAIATAADVIEDEFKEIERVAVALEALRQVPVAHLNPSVIAMFETHMPAGVRRVARESAMTPVNMRKVALESGAGFFASVKETFAKIWQWIKDRFNDFLGLFQSRESKMAEVEKKLDVVLKDIEKDLDKQIAAMDAAEAQQKQTGTFVKVGEEVVMVYQPTEATHIFFKGFSKDGILASIKEMEDGLDKSAAGVEKMRKFVENTTRIEARLGNERASSLGEKAVARLMKELPVDAEKGTCSIHAWPKQFVINTEGATPTFETVPVEPAGEQQPMLLTLKDFSAVREAVKRLATKSAQFIANSEKVIEGMQKNADAALERMEKLGEEDASIKAVISDLRQELPVMTRMFAHVLQGAVYHANLVQNAWLGACLASVGKNMAAPATESAKTVPQRQGYGLV